MDRFLGYKQLLRDISSETLPAACKTLAKIMKPNATVGIGQILEALKDAEVCGFDGRASYPNVRLGVLGNLWCTSVGSYHFLRRT